MINAGFENLHMYYPLRLIWDGLMIHFLPDREIQFMRQFNDLLLLIGCHPY